MIVEVEEVQERGERKGSIRAFYEIALFVGWRGEERREDIDRRGLQQISTGDREEPLADEIVNASKLISC